VHKTINTGNYRKKKIQENAGTQKNTGICRKYRNGESTAVIY